ncbi:MAG TPA: hypothetical protein VE988_11350, partial [Gemmataceae bacterium]|nr:hypothetical protein [Gemmataceae bacterium]
PGRRCLQGGNSNLEARLRAETKPPISQSADAAPTRPAEQLAKLITDLDSDRYAVRQEAVQELEKLGDRAEVAIWTALKNNPTLEAKQRLEQILKKQDNEVIRKLRAIEAIEHCENPTAATLLQILAIDSPNPQVAEAARAAGQRLSKLN